MTKRIPDWRVAPGTVLVHPSELTETEQQRLKTEQVRAKRNADIIALAESEAGLSNRAIARRLGIENHRMVDRVLAAAGVVKPPAPPRARPVKLSMARTLAYQARDEQIAALLAEGWGHTRIAAHMGVKLATVAKVAVSRNPGEQAEDQDAA